MGEQKEKNSHRVEARLGGIVIRISAVMAKTVGLANIKVRRHQRRYVLFFFSSRRRHTRLQGDWSSDVCSSDLVVTAASVESATATSPWATLASFAPPTGYELLQATECCAAAASGDAYWILKEIGRASCRERV